MSAPGDARMRRVESLVEELEACAEPATRRAARELVGLLLELHREGLGALVGLLADAGALERRCRESPALASVLLLHELHPRTLAERVEDALQGVRPRLQSAGWDAAIVSIDGEQVRARLIAGPGARSGAAFARLIEEAVLDFVPEVRGCLVEGAADAALVPLRVPERRAP